jgi:hypothetical protein
MGKKVNFALSPLYLMLLIYNLFAAQFVSSAISLLMFLLTSLSFSRTVRKNIWPLEKSHWRRGGYLWYFLSLSFPLV